MNRPKSAVPERPPPSDATRCARCATQSACPIARLDGPLFSIVAPLVTEHALARGSVLQSQGDDPDVLRVVKSGTVLLYRDGELEGRLPVAMAAAGLVIGAARLVNMPSLLTVVAAADTRVCQLSLADVEQAGILRAAAFRASLGEAVFRTLGLLADWAHVTRLIGVRVRLAAALLVLAAQQRSERVRLPGHAVLGELLGVTRESVARAMSALEAEGCIARLGRTYCELRTARLRQRCEAL